MPGLTIILILNIFLTPIAFTLLVVYHAIYNPIIRAHLEADGAYFDLGFIIIFLGVSFSLLLSPLVYLLGI